MTDVAVPTVTHEPRRPKTYDAQELMPDGRPACIILGDQSYFLRITRAGKLILTK
ncbi:Hemin uptake protein hemP [Octadecabacter temperatus]|uniref:Hemin uptake protein hemP n=1 Tax=Octadecabacter temperatus TaxID=1458307 RepID=A0A0K0Y608_9RHOB|nr:hemin uptake protein HemP [Octadecabacter temperatus]AKS46360.1 Hemin uptake protein hemP [Octadecabacter temperatus]SIO12545.1 Hemin uptake protein hemP [Octadecabacter temperatus]